jgi:hypothetical protein
VGYGKTFRDILPEKCEILVFIKNDCAESIINSFNFCPFPASQVFGVDQLWRQVAGWIFDKFM